MEGECSIWDVGKWNGRILRASRAERKTDRNVRCGRREEESGLREETCWKK